jgi:hypothetical protein
VVVLVVVLVPVSIHSSVQFQFDLITSTGNVTMAWRAASVTRVAGW